MGNYAIIGGLVRRPAYIDNDALCVDLKISRKDLKKDEYLTVHCYEKSLMKKALMTIEEGKYFFTSNAYIDTITYKRDKAFTCSECMHTEYQTVQSERTEVIFEDFSIIDCAGEYVEGVNKVVVSGNICSNINYREKDGKYYTKYKLGVNKQTYATKACYPFIVSFGKEAELAHKHLHKNSRVLVCGSVQERLVKQNKDFICPECKNRAIKKTPVTVREIIVSDVLYVDKIGDKDQKETPKSIEGDSDGII